MYKELNGFWVVVNFILTGVVIFFCIGISILIAEWLGWDGHTVAYGGVLVGLAFHKPIKSLLTKYFGKDIDMSKYVFTKPQEITHRMRLCTKKVESVWPSFVVLVSCATNGNFDKMVEKARNEKKLALPDDYYVELVCADFVVDNFLKNDTFINELKKKVEASNESLTDIESRLDQMSKIAYQELNNVKATENHSEKEVLTTTANIYAKRLWECMYEYTAKVNP